MITVYTITYNEQVLIQFMIDHYRQRFPDCRIVIYDNISTDDTVKIALANGCEVIPYHTNGQLQDSRYLQIKNNCWKEARTDWVLVCDLDEHLDITPAELKKEASFKTSIIKTKGYNMITLDDNLDIAGIKYGQRDEGEDKSVLFNKKFISEINYSPGAHACYPLGTLVYSKQTYKLFHYCYINYSLTVARYKVYAKRVSQENIDNHWGYWACSPAEIRAIYTDAWSKAVKIR